MFLREVYQNFDNLIQLDDDLRSAINKAMDKKYLNMHTGAIWFDEGKQLHCTKLGGKNKTSKTLEGLHKKIIEFYKSLDLSFHTVLKDELERKLRLKDISPATRDRYLIDYERYVKNSVLDKTPVPSVNSSQIRKFLEEKIIQGISKKNFDNLVGLLNIVYFYSELTNINACDVKRRMNLKARQFDKSNKRDTTEIAWTDDEQQALLNYSETHENLKSLGLVFMLQTGLAISELVQLHPADVDVDERELKISRIETKYKKDGKTVRDVSLEDSAKTETRLETMLLSKKAVETYKRIIAVSGVQADNDCIFKDLKGYDFDNYLHRHVLPDLGLSKRGLHSLRKTYATNLIDANVDFKTVQKQMRHSDIQTTLKFYYKDKSTKEKTLEVLDNVG